MAFFRTLRRSALSRISAPPARNPSLRDVMSTVNSCVPLCVGQQLMFVRSGGVCATLGVSVTIFIILPIVVGITLVAVFVWYKRRKAAAELPPPSSASSESLRAHLSDMLPELPTELCALVAEYSENVRRALRCPVCHCDVTPSQAVCKRRQHLQAQVQAQPSESDQHEMLTAQCVCGLPLPIPEAYWAPITNAERSRLELTLGTDFVLATLSVEVQLPSVQCSCGAWTDPPTRSARVFRCRKCERPLTLREYLAQHSATTNAPITNTTSTTSTTGVVPLAAAPTAPRASIERRHSATAPRTSVTTPAKPDRSIQSAAAHSAAQAIHTAPASSTGAAPESVTIELEAIDSVQYQQQMRRASAHRMSIERATATATATNSSSQAPTVTAPPPLQPSKSIFELDITTPLIVPSQSS
jgi:hypothetical protein